MRQKEEEEEVEEKIQMMLFHCAAWRAHSLWYVPVVVYIVHPRSSGSNAAGLF